MNKHAYDLIKASEGCRLKAYQDPLGIWTIGYGHTGPEVQPGLTWTMQEAEAALMARIIELENQITRETSVRPNEFEMGALIDFAYNVGWGALRGSTLWRLVTEENSPKDIADQFLRWNKNKLPGLKIRRQAEHDLYLTKK